MAKKKFYTVRVVNPSRAGPPRTIAVPSHNPSATDDPAELVDGVIQQYYAGELGAEEIRDVVVARARRWGADEGAVLDELAYRRSTGLPSRANPSAPVQGASVSPRTASLVRRIRGGS